MAEGNNGYERYRALGGIINRGDYENVLQRAQDAPPLTVRMVRRVVFIAEIAGIVLQTDNGGDQRAVFYSILRSDWIPEGVTYHHSQMGDQRLFGEALRMVGDTESLRKLIATYPHISFS